MRTTTTLHDLIHAGLEQMGHDEYFNDAGELVYFDDAHQFMKKIMTYDDDVHALVSNVFFQGFSFSESIDRDFKEQFLKKFLAREIKFQGVQLFGMAVWSTSKSLQGYIEEVCTSLDKYMLNQSESETTGGNKQTSTNQTNNTGLSEGTNVSINNNRSFDGELPESELNLDLNRDTTTWGGNNAISKGNQNGNTTNTTESETKTHGTNEQENDTKTISKEYRLELLKERMTLLDEIFDVYDEKCFLQVW